MTKLFVSTLLIFIFCNSSVKAVDENGIESEFIDFSKEFTFSTAKTLYKADKSYKESPCNSYFGDFSAECIMFKNDCSNHYKALEIGNEFMSPLSGYDLDTCDSYIDSAPNPKSEFLLFDDFKYNPCEDDKVGSFLACLEAVESCMMADDYFLGGPLCHLEDIKARVSLRKMITNINHTNKISKIKENLSQDISCCSSGICSLGGTLDSCNMAKSSLLNTGKPSQNDDLFELMSSLTLIGSTHTGVGAPEMTDELCEKCWGAAYNSLPQKSKRVANSYLEDLEVVKKKLHLSNSNIELETESKLRRLIDISMKGNTQNLEASLKSGVQCFDESSLDKLISENSSCEGRDNSKILDKFSYTSSEISQIQDELKLTNDDDLTKKVMLKFGDQSKLDELTEVVLNNISNRKDEILEKCREIKLTKKDSNSVELFEFITRIGSLSNEKDIMTSNDVFTLTARNSIYFKAFNVSTDTFCNQLAAPGADVDKMRNHINGEEIGFIGEADKVSETIKKQICPSKQEISRLVCGETMESQSYKKIIKPDELDSLTPSQHVVVSEYICKGLIEVGSNSLMSASGDNFSEERVSRTIENSHRVSEAISNDPEIVRQRNFAQTGQSILAAANRGNSDFAQTDLESPEIVQNASSDFIEGLNNLRNSNSQFNGNSSANLNDKMDEIEMNDVLKAAESNASIGDAIDRIANKIGSTNDSILANNISNPNQAVMDYLTDKNDRPDSTAVAALKASENSELRTELEKLKKQIANEKAISELSEKKKVASNDLDAARVRIKKLEGMVSQLQQGRGAGISQNPINSSQGVKSSGSGEYGINFSKNNYSREGDEGRGPASVQSPIVTGIPNSVQADIREHAKSGIEFKNDELVLVVDETTYPLNIEEVVMTNGEVSGIRIQNNNSEVVTLKLSDMKERSKVAVEKFLKSEGEKLLVVEKKNEVVAKEKVTQTSESYLQFLCSIHPDKEQCQ